jgi:hypothetical protein
MPLRSAPSTQEILECLQRSGYVLESRIVRSVDGAGYFVEPNQVVVDPRTGKSREIDLVAEQDGWDRSRPNVSVRTIFAIEAINNPLPIVLMTRRPWSPSAPFEDYVKCATTPDPSPFLDDVELFRARGLDNAVLYSQYCGITRKRGDAEGKTTGSQRPLMASHPDDMYSSLLKLSEFVVREVAFARSRDWREGDHYWRLWFWEAVLVVGGDLLAFELADDGTPSIDELDSGHLIFNFHANDEPKTVVVKVVRERRLLALLAENAAVDRRLAAELHSYLTSNPEPSAP